MSYWRFAAMIATSTVVMYGLMYLNTYTFEQVFWSETRAWMALLMGATMSLIMLGYMFGMYKRKVLNAAIVGGSVAVFAASLWLVRSQATVDDADYMKAMIPHHSIAILTSSRAQITDPRVRKLADEIIEAQEREIAEMKYLIRDGDAPSKAPEVATVKAAAQAVEGTHVPTLDPTTLVDAEVAKVLGARARCTFRYTSTGRPVIVAGLRPDGRPEVGLVKLNGSLVSLKPGGDSAGTAHAGFRLEASPVQVSVQPRKEAAPAAAGGRQVEADMVFEVGHDLRVGYGGYLDCAPSSETHAARR